MKHRELRDKGAGGAKGSEKEPCHAGERGLRCERETYLAGMGLRAYRRTYLPIR